MSTYKVIEVIGTSPKSWEEAAQSAVDDASRSLNDLRVAEVLSFDATLDDNAKITQYRTKLKLSFKYDTSG